MIPKELHGISTQIANVLKEEQTLKSQIANAIDNAACDASNFFGSRSQIVVSVRSVLANKRTSLYAPDYMVYHQLAAVKEQILHKRNRGLNPIAIIRQILKKGYVLESDGKTSMQLSDVAIAFLSSLLEVADAKLEPDLPTDK